jgi:anti-sigma regulatory factor (Ser/Thr protein kinase)
MSGAVHGFDIELAGDLDASAAARRAVRDHVPELAEPLQGDVLLLVTELVTNAVEHGGAGPEGSVRLECRSSGDRLRFLVTDPGTERLSNGRPPVHARPGSNGDHASGWGLYLVEQIAERWGVVAASPGTCVWFDVAV